MPNPYQNILAQLDPREVRNAQLWNPLAMAGANMLAMSGPSRTPQGIGPAIGAGLQGFNQGREAGTQQLVQKYMLGLQMQDMERKRRAEEERQAAIGRLDPKYKDWVLAGAGEQAAAAALRPPERPDYRNYKEVAGGLFDVAAGDWKVPPKADAETFAHLRATNGGLWNSKENRWEVPPTADAPKTQVIDLPGGMQQRQEWVPAQQGWRNVGEPVPRWQPERPPIVTNPLSGESGIVDRGKGTLTPLTQPPPSLPQNVPAREKPVLADVSQYGPLGAASEAAQKYTFGAYQPGVEATAARQKYRLLRETMIDAFARSSRPSNYAQERVEELMPNTGVFESQTRAYDMMTETYQTLQQNMAEDMAVAQDRTMPLTEQREAISRIRAAQRALAMIGDPSQWPRPGEEKHGTVPAGIDPALWRVMTPAGRALWQKN